MNYYGAFVADVTTDLVSKLKFSHAISFIFIDPLLASHGASNSSYLESTNAAQKKTQHWDHVCGRRDVHARCHHPPSFDKCEDWFK